MNASEDWISARVAHRELRPTLYKTCGAQGLGMSPTVGELETLWSFSTVVEFLQQI